MKALINCFYLMMRRIWQDAMLAMIILVPLLIAIMFSFIPDIEHLLTGYLQTDQLLSPYFELFDIFLIIVTPSMFSFIAAMVMLEETDEHITTYLSVTPLGKKGYLFSRLGFSSLISFPASFILVVFFHLSQFRTMLFLGVALVGTIQGVVAALLIVSVSSNKVEGMAVGKMVSLFNLGAIIPYFIAEKVQYIVSFMPSFWISKAVQTDNFLLLIIAALTASLWIALLSGKFMKKIS